MNLSFFKFTVIAVLVFCLQMVVVQAVSSGCIETNGNNLYDRPLLNKTRTYFPDSLLGSGNFSYSSLSWDVPELTEAYGVTLYGYSKWEYEFVDRDYGGVIESNVKKGLANTMEEARNTLPTGSVELPTLSPQISINDMGACENSSRCGIGWGWNSILFELDGERYEIVCFFHGFSIYTGGNPFYSDNEVHMYTKPALRICPQKLSPPEITPPGTQFSFKQELHFTAIDSGVEIFYRFTDTEDFVKYTGTAVEITNNTVLEAFAKKESWENSDTISEVYSKTGYSSDLKLYTANGVPLGGLSYLTENDSNFVIRLTTANANLTRVAIVVNTVNRDDLDTIVLSNPLVREHSLLFEDTIPFIAGSGAMLPEKVNAGSYDSVKVRWVNPENANDNPSASFSVIPGLKEAKVYFADSNGTRLLTNLNGTENRLYAVVEDAVLDPARLSGYVVTFSNKYTGNGGRQLDNEVVSLVELIPGKYIAPLNVSTSGSVQQGNNTLDIQPGDELRVAYISPLSFSGKNDIIGFGVAAQQPGNVFFTNEDWSVPAEVMPGNIWDVEKDVVYLKYTDDYLSSLILKKARITIVNTNARGKTFVDTEIVNLTIIGMSGNIGTWAVFVPLEGSSSMIPGDGKLQFHFKAVVTAEIATHTADTVETVDGDTVRTVLNLARMNAEERVLLKDAVSGKTVDRHTAEVQVCVEDQVFNEQAIDTLLLEKVTCVNSGDKIVDVALIQTAVGDGEYCGSILKREGESGTILDSILHCQDVDNLVGYYTDPVYGTKAVGRISLFDNTITQLMFQDMTGAPVSVFSEGGGNRVKLSLTYKSPDLYSVDTLPVRLNTSGGDSLILNLIETGTASNVFETEFSFGFSETPHQRDSVLEGTLNLQSFPAHMTVTAVSGKIEKSLEIISAYVPVKRCWIVDGNNDGQADSIYIRFHSSLSVIPEYITSIDWPDEGLQGYKAAYLPSNPSMNVINYASWDLTTISVLLPGVLNRQNEVFPLYATSLSAGGTRPTLQLPVNSAFQGLTVPIEDGMGAVITKAWLISPGTKIFKDSFGRLRKTPDTLVITLSEKIKPLHDKGALWDSLFLFQSSSDEYSVPVPLTTMTGSVPVIQGEDSLEWVFIINNDNSQQIPFVGDLLYMNSESPYVDLSPAANRPGSAAVV
ncbi:MAG: hypothetical protein HQK83_19895, partial [Fibrobacteria bacterium]|nr:hypothetical protein [Fibrobacteria bacterium]